MAVAGKGKQKPLNLFLFGFFQLILEEQAENSNEDLVWN